MVDSSILNLNFESPLFLYLCVLIAAATIRIILVIQPLYRIHRRFHGEVFNIVRMIIDLIRATGVSGIQAFILREGFLLILPSGAVLVLRLSLGNPQEIDWNQFQIIMFVSMISIWMAYDVWGSFQTKRSLRPLESNQGIQGLKHSPFVIKTSLLASLKTRQVMSSISKWDEKQQFDFISGSDGESSNQDIFERMKSMGKKTVVATQNLYATTQNTLKDVAKDAVNRIDRKTQQTVDEYLPPPSRNRIISFTIYLATIFVPLYVIYGVLPILG